MTAVEFDKKLNEIDFKIGTNIISMEIFALACITQLRIYKNHVPTYDLLLTMYQDARNCNREEFNPTWKTMPDYSEKKYNLLGKDNFEWEKTYDQFCSLAADLTNTRELRSRPDFKPKYDESIMQDWKTEEGLIFYNGTSPEEILKYSATRFIGQYHPSAYKESKITWQKFWENIIIGISYE